MAGGGTNEIVVRIVSGLKGGAKPVVDDAKRQAEKQEEVKAKAAEKARKEQATAEEKALASQRKKEEAARKAKDKELKAERDRQIKYDEDVAKAEKKTREKAEREEGKRKAAARRREETEARKANHRKETEARQSARRVERESVEYIRRQGYRSARRSEIAALGKADYLRERGKPIPGTPEALQLAGFEGARRRDIRAAGGRLYLKSKGMPLPGTPEYYEQQGYKSAEAALSRKAGKERFMSERGIVSAAKAAGGRVRAAKAPPPPPGSEEEYQQMVAAEEEKERRKAIRTRIRQKLGFSKVHTGPSGGGRGDDSPPVDVLGSALKGVFSFLSVGAGFLASRIKQGISANQQFVSAQSGLTGLINPGARFGVRSGSFYRAANMGMSSQELISSTAAYARAMGRVGSHEGGLMLAAVKGRTGMDVGESAGVLSSIRGRGRSSKQALNDMAEMFGIAAAAGIKDETRQPEFVKAFSQLMLKAHEKGAKDTQVGRVVSSISRLGGSVGGLYAIGAAEKLDQAVSGGAPMTSQAAFMRMALGYGRPGSKMDFFGAEAARRKGILQNPASLVKFLDTLRDSSAGNEKAMAYQLVNMAGLEQDQAERIVKMHGIGGAARAQDIYNEAKAQKNVSVDLRTKLAADQELMTATAGVTNSLNKMNAEINSFINRKKRDINDVFRFFVGEENAPKDETTIQKYKRIGKNLPLPGGGVEIKDTDIPAKQRAVAAYADLFASRTTLASQSSTTEDKYQALAKQNQASKELAAAISTVAKEKNLPAGSASLAKEAFSQGTQSVTDPIAVVEAAGKMLERAGGDFAKAAEQFRKFYGIKVVPTAKGGGK